MAQQNGVSYISTLLLVATLALLSVALPPSLEDRSAAILASYSAGAPRLVHPALDLAKRTAHPLPYTDQLQQHFDKHTTKLIPQIGDTVPQSPLKVTGGRKETPEEVVLRTRHAKYYAVAKARSSLLRRLQQEYKNGRGISLERIGLTIQEFERQVAANFKSGLWDSTVDSIVGTDSRINLPKKIQELRNIPQYRGALEKEIKPILKSTPKIVQYDAAYKRNVATSSEMQSALTVLGDNAEPKAIGEAAMDIISKEYWPRGFKALPVMGVE